MRRKILNSGLIKFLQGLLLVATLAIGAFGNSILIYKDKINSNQYLGLTCRNLSGKIDYELEDISSFIDLVAAKIIQNVKTISNIYNEEIRQEINEHTAILLSHHLENSKLPGTAYLRWSSDLLGDNDGFFYVRRRGRTQKVPITDISRYAPTDMEHVGWYYLPIANGNPMWTDPYRNDNIGMYMVSYIVPLFLNGQAIGVIGYDIDLDELIRTINSLEVYKTGFTLLQDKSGNILNHTIHENSRDLVSTKTKLRNNMTLVLLAPKNEVYHRDFAKISFIAIILYLLLFFLVITATFLNTVTGNDFSFNEKRIRLRNHRITLVVFISIVFIFQIAVIVEESGLFQYKREQIKALNCFDKTLNVVACRDVPPYSYLDNEGKPEGYNIELINEIANLLSVNIDIKLLPWKECLSAVQNGKADIILGYNAFTAGKKSRIISTSATIEDPLVIYGKNKISSVSELLSKKIAKIQGMEQADIYGLSEKAQSFPTYEEALQSVADGQNDYVIIRQNIARAICNSKGYRDLKEVYDLLNQEMTMGVLFNRPDLMEKLNFTLLQVKKDGTLQMLEDVWIKRYLENQTIFDIIKNNKILFEGTFFIILLCLVCIYISYNTDKTKQLVTISETDELTGILNRRGGERRIEQLISNSRRGMFCILDADKFKKINDTYGHSTGDKVLSEIAACMKKVLRDHDVAMRLGGDEFAVFVEGITTEETGQEIINRLFSCISNMTIKELEGKQITVSLGATIFLGDSETDFIQLYKKADAGTYTSKKKHGNACTFVN